MSYNFVRLTRSLGQGVLTLCAVDIAIIFVKRYIFRVIEHRIPPPWRLEEDNDVGEVVCALG